TAAEAGEVREEAHGRARDRPKDVRGGPRRATSLSKRSHRKAAASGPSGLAELGLDLVQPGLLGLQEPPREAAVDAQGRLAVRQTGLALLRAVEPRMAGGDLL